MRVNFLRSSFGDASLQFATTLVVNERCAIDAGCLGFADLAVQAAVRDVVLTHAHLDHVATLPLFAINVLQLGLEPARFHAPPDVLDTVRGDLFNDRLWPDLEKLATPERPLIEFHELPVEEPVAVGPITVTAVPVEHPVPTYGYLLSEPGCTVVVGTDTSETTRLWELAAACEDLAGVFIESSFPESLAELAVEAGHLTPQGTARQLDLLNRDVRAIAVHLKPSHHAELVDEIAALGRDRLEVGSPGTVYEF